MSSERSASFGAWSESARRTGISDSLSRSIPGIQPTVEIAAKLHRAGRAEGACKWAPGLRGDADRPPPVPVAHEHRLDRTAVGRVEEGLDRAVLRTRLVH